MSFDPAESTGLNQTAESAISADGTPDYDRTYTIAPRTGIATLLQAGDTLTITNPSGHQVCDFWTFRYPGITEYLSMAHTHTALDSIMPKPGDVLVTNNRTPILRFLEDTSPGIHDTVMAACDLPRYHQLGVSGYHDNCTDNLRMALAAIGLSLPAIPAPFNVWMNIPVEKDGSIRWQPPVSEKGDFVRFEALVDCVAVMSACPQDLTPVNGLDTEPDKLTFQVTR